MTAAALSRPEFTAWFADHQTLLAWAFAASILMFVGGLVGVPWLVVRMPADFFLRHDRPRPHRHPVVHAVLVVLRNLLGWALLAAGIAMLVLPGQGLLTILVAIALMDFPGKRRVELALVRERHLHRAIDWIRRRAGRPPLVLPDDR
jgi:hypothetical protein